MTAPTTDPALCIELGRRAVIHLMTQADWRGVLDRIEHWVDTDAPMMPEGYYSFGERS